MTKKEMGSAQKNLTNKDCVEKEEFKTLDHYFTFESSEGTTFSGNEVKADNALYYLVELSNGNGAVLRITIGEDNWSHPKVVKFFGKNKFEDEKKLFFAEMMFENLNRLEPFYNVALSDMKNYLASPFPQNKKEALKDEALYKSATFYSVGNFLDSFTSRIGKEGYEILQIKKLLKSFLELNYQVEKRLKVRYEIATGEEYPILFKEKRNKENNLKKLTSKMSDQEYLQNEYFKVIGELEIPDSSEECYYYWQLVELDNGNWAYRKMYFYENNPKKIFKTRYEILKTDADILYGKVVFEALKYAIETNKLSEYLCYFE